ncbi:hypothetical protein FRX31_007499 [Thalictrum thalictroides]|uniref:Uncharacterized protein n=1 Tax=Thalictrum thalictroides TaxID=46969 RepID=A0A7J6WZL9_THATH|nr:hypothetical protein FRX31_007499 [Thalictrum thalictroides]
MDKIHNLGKECLAVCYDLKSYEYEGVTSIETNDHDGTISAPLSKGASSKPHLPQIAPTPSEFNMALARKEKGNVQIQQVGVNAAADLTYLCTSFRCNVGVLVM